MRVFLAWFHVRRRYWSTQGASMKDTQCVSRGVSTTLSKKAAKMKSLKLLVVLALLVAAGLSAAPARADHTTAPPIDRSRLPVLAGQTTVVGSESGWMRVRLPKPVDLGKYDSWDTGIKGNGRIIGMFMLEEKNGEVDNRGADMWLQRFGNCDTRACEPDPFVGAWMSADTDRDGTLPAGIYRIYFVVDGARASATFDLPGLPGETRINPTRPVRAKVTTLTPRIHEETTGVVFSAGDKRPFGGDGIALQGQWADPVGAGVFDWGYCLYPETAPADQTTAYIPPPCETHPGWPVNSVRTYTPLAPCCYGFQLALDYLPKAMGNWYTASGPVEDSGAVALWLKLN